LRPGRAAKTISAKTPSPARDTARVFFAAWPDPEAQAALEKLARDCAARTGGRAPDPANLHVTLAFIGNVDPGRVVILREAGSRAAAAATPFTLVLDRIGAFRKQEIAWLGCSRVSEAMQALADGLFAQLAAAGFALERRPFRPHVTLARRARTRALDSTRDGALAAPVVWNVSRLTLNASTHALGALRYVPIDSWPLGGGSDKCGDECVD
jgi:2'-5' RNA ligase